jgi:hypothetical protein
MWRFLLPGALGAVPTQGRAALRLQRFRLVFFGFRALPALTLVSPVGFATICFFLGSLHIEGFILSERDVWLM